MKPSLLAPGEQVGMWTLRAMSIAARRSPPMYRITGHYHGLALAAGSAMGPYLL